MDLTEHERALAEKVRGGDEAAFGPNQRALGEPTIEIRAEVLRRVALGLPLAGDTESHRVAPSRVEVVGVVVTGALDLSNGRRPDGGALGALIFRNCMFKEEIKLRAADLARLSFLDCRFTRIDAEAVHVRGPVDLSGSASAEAPTEGTGCQYGEEAAHGRAQVDLRGARIEGDLTASNATLCAAPYDPEQDYSDRKSPSALGLAGADVHGSLMLQPGFRAFGGVDAQQARIGGSVFMNGAYVCADGPYSLRFDLAVIERSMILGALFKQGAKKGTPFISEGVVRLYSTRVHGELWLAGADLRPHRKPRRDSDPDQHIALNGFMAEIGKAMRCIVGSEAGCPDLPFRARGAVVLQMARLGAFYASGASFDGDGQYALQFGGARIDGDLEISSKTEIFGGIFGPDLRVSQAFRLTDTTINAPRTTGEAKQALGDVVIYNASIGGDLHVSKVEANLINGAGARISGSLTVQDADLASQLSMQTCKIGGNLRLLSVRVASQGWCVDALGTEVGGAVLLQASANGRVRLSSMNVRGETRLNGLECGERASLDFKGTVFTGGLAIGDGGAGGKSTISVKREAKRADKPLAARAIDLAFYPGWKLLELRYPEGVAAALWNGRHELIELPGVSPPIHEFNKNRKILLNDKTVRAYLEFFCAHVWGDEGAFRIVRSPQELAFWGYRPDAPPPELGEALAGAVTREGETWRTKALVDYGGNLFESDFRILPSGMVEMVDDTPLKLEPAAGRRTLYSGGLRYANAWPPGAVWFRGPWRPVTGADANRARSLVPQEISIRDLRARDLACYPGWRLLQALITHPDGLALRAWLWDGDRQAIALPGESGPIHAFNGRSPSPLKLETDEQIKDYLRFFCAHVWGDQGPFLLIDDADEMPFDKDAREDRAGVVRPLLLKRADGEITAEATVVYGGHVFHSTFKVEPTGAVTMVDDKQIEMKPAEVTLRFAKPQVVVVETRARETANWPVPAAFEKMRAIDVPAAVKKAFRRQPGRPTIDLTGARASMFDDDFGKAWGKDVVMLRLGGFSYEHLDTGPMGAQPQQAGVATAQFDAAKPREEEQRGKKRKEWLRLQFDDPKRGPASLNQFDSQPHAQLAHIYRRAGRLDDARVIDHDRLHLEGRLGARDWRRKALSGWRRVLVGVVLALAAGAAALAGIGIWADGFAAAGIAAALLALVVFGPGWLNSLYNLLFGHGLYTRNALATFLSCLLIGWVGAEVANRGAVLGFVRFSDPVYDQIYGGAKASILVRDVTNTPDVIVRPDEPNAPPRLGWRLADDGGDNFVEEIPCADEIQPFLYATDVFIPLVDLRQESQCRPRGDAVSWNVAKALYALLGWVVTSLTILTVSGILRRRSQAPE